MKATKRILSGLLVLAMVLALCPFMTFAEETTDAVVSIAAFTNGTVTADKESYKIGETVTLTIAPEAGYSQKLTINGEPLLLDWKTGTYSFVAAENKYVIAGSFEPALSVSGDGKWDTANQAQGILTAYYTSGDSGWLGIDSNSESITVKAKNYLLGTDGTGVNDFLTLLGFKINNKNYTFRVVKQGGKYYCQRAGFAKPEGGSDWTKKELDAAAIEKILNDGVDFKLERIAADRLAIYVNGVLMDSYTMSGVTADHAVTKIYIGHDGNDGEKVAIPFKIANPVFRVTGGSWNLDNQYDGSVTILNKTKDGSTIITNASDYKGVSVTVKDYLPTYDANGAITPNNFAMQFAFIFDNGKQYQVRLHNTDSKSPNYKLQNMGGTNCLTGWKWLADLDAAQKQNLLEGDGVKITVMLEGPDVVLYADGQKKATVPLGEEYAGKLVQIQLCMNGNKTGGNIEIPFELIKASEEHIHTPATAVVENKTDATCDTAGSYDSVVYCSECGELISRETVTVPATGEHTYTYTNNNDGTHTHACSGCSASTTEKHEYVNNACVCGHTLVDMITDSSATLKAMLQLDFNITTSKLSGTDNYAVITHTYADGTTDVITVPQSQWANGKQASYSKIAAKEMGDSVTIVIYNANGQQLSIPETDSIKAYAYRGLVALADYNTGSMATLRTLLVDMLNYGAAAQIQFNYDTANLVNADLTDAQKAWATKDDIVLTNNQIKDAATHSTALTLKSAIQIDFIFFTNKVGTAADWANRYAIVTYTDHYGNEKEMRIEGTSFAKYYTNAYVQVNAVGMAVADYQAVVTCVIYDSNGNVLATAADSMEGYAKRALDSGEAGEVLENLCKALMKFSASADAFFK